MIRRLALIFGFLLFLLVAALIAIAVLFDPNDYKDEISAAAGKATGREFHIVDDMKLSLFPWFGLEFGEVVMANAQGFGPDPFARISSAKIKVRLMPLLSRRIEIDTVTLSGLEMRLETDKSGRTNWGDLTNRPDAGDRSGSTTIPATGDGSDAAFGLPAALSISGLDVRKAAFYWRDQAAGTALEFTDLNLHSGRIESGRPVDLELGFDLKSQDPALQGHIDLSSRITARIPEERYLAENLKITLKLTGHSLPVTPLTVALQGGIDADLKKETAELPAISITIIGLQISGAAKADHILSAPAISGRLEIAGFSPRALLKTLGEDAPETVDPAVLSQAALSLRFASAAGQTRLTEIDARIDDTRLRGMVSILDPVKPAFSFDISLDRVDVDRYLPPSALPAAAAVPAAPAAAMTLPLETLRVLEMDGKLGIDSLKASGLSLNDIRAEARARGGLITLTPVSASLYGGRYTGDIRLDARGETPQLNMDASLTAVQAEPILKDLFDIDLISGVTDFRLKSITRGTSEEELRRSLTGAASFTFRNGAIKGFNAAQMIREVKARLEGRPPPPEVTMETDFAELTGSLIFTNGQVRNDDLRASSPYLRLGGNGQADLVRESIDYRLRAKIVDTSVGQGGAGLENVKGIEIPIRVSGALAKPDIGIDTEVIRNLLRDKLTKELEGKTQDLKRQLELKEQEIRRQAQEKQEEIRQQIEREKKAAQEQLQNKLQDKLKGLTR